MTSTFDFTVSEDVRTIGVKVIGARFEGVQNRVNDSEIEILRRAYSDKLAKELTPEFITTDLVLKGFRTLHEKVGRSNRRFPSASEALVSLFVTKGKIPAISSVVDIYNLISLDTRLALGAHDLSFVEGNVTLRLTNGSERYLPLGATQPEPVGAGEYCYVDDSNEIICRLEHKQVQKTKITEHSNNSFFIIQGNESTPPELLESALEALTVLLSEHCSAKLVQTWNFAES